MSGIPAGSYLVAGLHAQESQGWQEANSLKKIQSRALSPPAKVNVVAGSVVVVNLSLVDTAQPGSLVGMGRALLRFIALPADRTSKEFSRPLTGGSQ
jgi:hypothetical protein